MSKNQNCGRIITLIDHVKKIMVLNTCVNNMYKKTKVFNVIKRHNPIVSTSNNIFTQIYNFSTNSVTDNWTNYIKSWTNRLFRNTMEYLHVHQKQLYQLFEQYNIDSYKECLQVMYNNDYLHGFNVESLKNKLESAQRYFSYKICCFFII